MFNGNIDGDLFVAAQSITINGTVKGSIFTAAQNVKVNGEIDNNIYSAGDTLKLQSETEGSAFLAGRNIYLEDKAIINRDMFVAGATVHQDGVINGDLNSSSESLEVSGKIAGNLNYLSRDEANLSNDAEIGGKTNWKKVEPKAPKTPAYVFILLGVLFSILTALIVWLVVRLIRPDFWVGFADKILSTPLKTFGFGTLAFFLVPIIIFFLMLTVIGIPLSFILLAMYVISIYISKIILSSSIAFWFQKKYHWSNGVSFWLFLLSLILLSLLGIVPFIGWIFRFMIVAFGLGSIVLSLKKKKTIVTPESQNFN